MNMDLHITQESTALLCNTIGVDAQETKSLCCAAAGIIAPLSATAEVLIPHEKLREAATPDATLIAQNRPPAQPVVGYTHPSNIANAQPTPPRGRADGDTKLLLPAYREPTMKPVFSPNTTCIYHANCADGFGAAWVVRKALGPDVEFHSAHYGEPAPDVTGKNVIIVDFSYKYDALVALADKAESVLVIDHHKTAMADLANVPQAELHYEVHKKNSTGKLHALFDMNRSGAGLVWDFFFPQHQRPDLINHIEDRDLWLFKLEGTREIQASVFSYPYDFEVWDGLFAADVSALRSDGCAIERKHHKDVAELVGVTKRRMMIGGHDVPVANLPYTLTSDAGHLMSAGEPFAACYWDTLEGRSFSLRSSDEGEDVSAIAKQYGGGGHRNASGFRVSFDHALANSDQHVVQLQAEVSRLTIQFGAMQLQRDHHRGRADALHESLTELNGIERKRDALQIELTHHRNLSIEAQDVAAGAQSELTKARGLLRNMLMAMARTLEAGRDQIIGFGGDCDSVEMMMNGDPTIIEVRAALKPTEPGASESAAKGESDE